MENIVDDLREKATLHEEAGHDDGVVDSEAFHLPDRQTHDRFFGDADVVKVERVRNGGLKLVHDQLFKMQRRVLWDILKSASKNLFTGKSIINVSLPVRIFEPRSFLQRITDGWCFQHEYLTKAAEARDPVERMKYVITFVVSGLYLKCKQEKPFNPILGETFQGSFPNGSRVMLEQTSHHPPVSNFFMEGPEGKYKFYGHLEWHAHAKTNSLDNCEERGPLNVEFDDGSVYTFTLPYSRISGTMWGDRVVEWLGSLHFECKRHSLTCDLAFGENKGGFWRSLFSARRDAAPSDSFTGSITRGDGSIACEVHGSWIDFIEFDGHRTWTLTEVSPEMLLEKEDPLPSDSRFRKDLVFLGQKDMEKAQEWKQKLEEIQRYDRKLRKDSNKGGMAFKALCP